jgi:hypothetical protein
MTDELPDGVMENGVFRRCQQINCGFFQAGGCQPCADCKAAPFNIRKSCMRCDSCEHVQDALRWDDELTKLLGAKKVILVGEQLPPVDNSGMPR